jgi:hypothetical protein
LELTPPTVKVSNFLFYPGQKRSSLGFEPCTSLSRAQALIHLTNRSQLLILLNLLNLPYKFGSEKKAPSPNIETPKMEMVSISVSFCSLESGFLKNNWDLVTFSTRDFI